MNPKILALGLAALCISARGADLVPIEDFARPATNRQARLSPDGRYCAVIQDPLGRDQVFFAELSSLQLKGFDLGKGEALTGNREVAWFRWLDPKRVLVGISIWNYMEGTAAYDCNGTQWTPLTGAVGYREGMLDYRPLNAYQAIHSFGDDTNTLMLELRGDPGDESRLYPDVIKIDTRTGAHRTVVKNPGRVVGWVADRQGVIRAGLEVKSIHENTILYRDDDKSPWRPLTVVSHSPSETPMMLGFSYDGKGIYICSTSDKGYRNLYCCDIATGSLGEPLLEVPGYDVEFSHSGPLVKSIWSDHRKAIVGYAYMGEGPGVRWFDEEYARRMAIIDALRPGVFNLPVSTSEDDTRMLIFSYSDRNPGAYYLYTPKDQKLEGLFRTRPWIKPEQMAPMNPMSYTARDGLVIHGYLTVPLGQKPRNLPLVVMPHGGPWVRDAWEFDPLVQMLANRGYAVLQMNYRGSAGYGTEFSNKGKKQVGGDIQNDIEDATRWAIAKKVADPKRIAIVGASYGGYSALYGLGKSSDLYRCGISICGVSDWLSIFKSVSEDEDKLAREHWTEQIGNPTTDSDQLKAISPLYFADKIVAPLLIIHGKDDRTVPYKQAKKMAAALEALGRPPQTLFLSDEGHGFRKERSLLQEYKTIEAFLAKHLGPGATNSTEKK
ncbi:MAG: S9 family peptidase [Nibricoccus sp.]